MYLTRHLTPDGPRWAVDDRFLPADVTLGSLLALPASRLGPRVEEMRLGEAAGRTLLPPIEADHEVWAAGVTYLRSRDARETESSVKDIYSRVYKAERPEVFFKAIGWRVAGHEMPIRVRRDSRWNVPEPELTLVVNAHGQVVGFCAGNDVSSRDIEGENPLYLPQAKVYRGSCALGPGIVLCGPDDVRDLGVRLEVTRAGSRIFRGETRTSRMKRAAEELVACLAAELDFPRGVFLMTGTGIVPPNDFSLAPGDRVLVGIGPITLENHVCP